MTQTFTSTTPADTLAELTAAEAETAALQQVQRAAQANQEQFQEIRPTDAIYAELSRYSTSFSGYGLSRIVEAIEISRATRRVMRQNMVWSVCYNFSAMPLAAVGLVPPWLAAMGMSASSLVVVGNALRLNRFRSRALPAEAPPPTPAPEPNRVNA